jgi:hypothetical protein
LLAFLNLEPGQQARTKEPKMSNFNPKRLRVVQKGYENYTGPIGEYEFKDGLSLEYIPFNARERLAAAFQMLEIDEDGSQRDASVASRILRDHELNAALAETLRRQTDAEKIIENVSIVVGSAEIREIYTTAAIEDVASKYGIAGLRIIAEPWNVRSKSIPELINLIDKAQQAYRAQKIEELLNKGVLADDAEAMFNPKGVVPTELLEGKPVAAPQDTAAPKAASKDANAPVAASQDTAALKAAATGDLAAAVSVGE